MLFKLRRVEATKWQKNGDHPKDYVSKFNGQTEGAVVRRFRHPDFDGKQCCLKCSKPYDDHGWIDQTPDMGPVCPGTYIVTVGYEYEPLDAKIFEALFKPAH